MDMYIWECSCTQRPEEGVRPLGSGVIGCCELPDEVAGMELRPSARTVRAFNAEPSLQPPPILLTPNR